MGDPIAELIRRERAAIVREWEAEVRRDAPGRPATGPTLRDRVDELLTGIAASIEGNGERSERDLAAIAESPALRALGYAGGLDTLIRELAMLRVAIVRVLGAAPEVTAASRASLHAAIDRAIRGATRRFAQLREDARDHFIGVLGHDLRDPLNAVAVTARMLGRDPRIRVHTSRIEHACERMMRMVDDLLDFARGHIGSGIPAHLAPSDLGEICRQVTDEIAVAHAERPIKVELHGDLHADVDRNRAAQAVGNLVANAIQHATGPIEVVARESDGHQAIVTSVTSHGPPISHDEIARIFDPFQRDDAPVSRAGLGLGLFIVQEIARAHGAECHVSSTLAGTTFSIRWPRPRELQQRRAS